MSIDVHSKVDKEDKPLTRADVERLLHEVESSDKLNLSGQNLEGIDLRSFKLAQSDLRGAELRGADLRGVDLWGADLRGANLDNVIGLDAKDVENEKVQDTASTIRLRIMEEPLTPYNLTLII